MKVREIGRETIIVTGNTDDEYIDILEEVKNAICKVAPDCGVTVKVMFGFDKENDKATKANEVQEANTSESKKGVVDTDLQINFDDGTCINLDPAMKSKPAFNVRMGDTVDVIIKKI